VSALDLVHANLLSPAVLAFALGAVARLLKSDLRLPEPVYVVLSTYLLLSIGLRGGAELAHTKIADIWLPAAVTIALGASTPLWCFAVLTKFGRFGVADAAAIAAHYGSVSAVTFIAALTYVQVAGLQSEGYLPTLVAFLEVPGIVVALLLAARLSGRTETHWSAGLREVLTGRSVVLLLGGLAIGAACGPSGIEKVHPFFVAPFHGVLVLFMLEMGLLTADRLRELRRVGTFLVAFALLAPIVHGALGAVLARAVGLSEGGAVVFATMAASASYIAAPAAVRVSLPQANPSYYLTASLAVTFPFNLTIGIPLYHQIVVGLYG